MISNAEKPAWERIKLLYCNPMPHIYNLYKSSSPHAHEGISEKIQDEPPIEEKTGVWRQNFKRSHQPLLMYRVWVLLKVWILTTVEEGCGYLKAPIKSRFRWQARQLEILLCHELLVPVYSSFLIRPNDLLLMQCNIYH